jgi:hypothetical protein
MKHYTGSDLGQDFRSFFTKESKRIKAELTKLGCTDIQLSRQFYYYYGFFTAPSGQKYYLSCSDVRHFSYTRILYRTAKDYKDYTGGSNCYIAANELGSIKLI